MKGLQKDFPILRRKFAGRRLIYLDSAATSQKPSQVIDSISSYYKKSNANPHRGVYELSAEATLAYETARKRVAGFIEADPRGLVFTRNATEAINLVAYSWARENVSKGQAILLTQLEHHSNLVPWQAVARERKASLLFAPATKSGELDLQEFYRLLEENDVALCAFTQASNVLGAINPAREMSARAKKAGAKVLVDAAQSVPHFPVSFKELAGADFLAFSGHKMLGPMGIGCLAARPGALEEMNPFLYGGDMISKVEWNQSSWNEVPWKFEAGTPNVAGAVGLDCAVGYLQKIGMGKVREHEAKLTAYALKSLSRISGVSIYGPSDARKRTGVVAFNIAGVHAHDAASLLDSFGIAVRAGHHCAMPLVKSMGLNSTLRASFYVYNDSSDIDALADGIKEVKRVFST